MSKNDALLYAADNIRWDISANRTTSLGELFISLPKRRNLLLELSWSLMKGIQHSESFYSHGVALGWLSLFVASHHFDLCPNFLSKHAGELSVAIWAAHETAGTDNWLRHIVDGPAAMRASCFSGVHFTSSVMSHK
jgi:hypothetical protein